jgi:predicted  nucleic acid-binding Zn-ribbon protein
VIVTDELQRLWRLRELDEEIAVCKEALKRFDSERRVITERLDAERGRLDSIKQRLSDMQMKRRQLERDIETLMNEERRLQGQLPSVKKNEEYTALLHEIANTKSKRSDVETKVLVQLDEEERVQGERPEIERVLLQAERDGAARREKSEAEETADRSRIEACDSERRTQLEGLPALTRSRYERIHASREGRAVVPILKNACGGCFRQQPPQTLQEARRGERVLICDGCGRMLIWPPDAI